MKQFSKLVLASTIVFLTLGCWLDGVPAVQADSSILQWGLLQTPGASLDKNDIVTSCEVSRLAIGADDKTFYAIDIANANNFDGGRAIYRSTDAGNSWDDNPGKRLFFTMTPAERAHFRAWEIAIAPDNVNLVAVVTSSTASTLPLSLWVSEDGGDNWHNTNAPVAHTISALDIASLNSAYSIAIGTRSGAGNGSIFILNYTDVPVWVQQEFSGDILGIKFSPNYEDDQALCAVYSSTSGTYLDTVELDPYFNTTQWNSVFSSPVEITTTGVGSSAKADEIISADIELPTDFQGQAGALRRYYISIDALSESSGIFRIDDTVVYRIMQASDKRRISSIAYFGSYTSGKLLAGEVLGNLCDASVMTWFTDTPVTCTGTCWYPAKKAPTGAAGKNDCTGSGYGNAQVFWSADGEKAYCGTASSEQLVPGPSWANPYLSGQNLDESAFSISHNNGASWNQISLIDTQISCFKEIAAAPNCSCLYLASINLAENCSGFDSVWRSQESQHKNWERVLCKPTTDQLCAGGQTDEVILNLAEDKSDGEVIFWGAQNTRLLMWSSDHGDSWFRVPSRLRVQDLTAENSNNLYVLEDTGTVQKLEYRAGGWNSASMVMSGLDRAYSISSAFTGNTPDNIKHCIIIGGQQDSNCHVAYSDDNGKTYHPIQKRLPTEGNVVVMASSSFDSDGTILAINAGGMYAWSIYGGQEQAWETWWGGLAWPSPVTGMAISRNYSIYFTTPAGLWAPATPYIRWASALSGLDSNISLGDAEAPGKRIKICGGLISGENITVYIIDQRAYIPPQGGIWYYEDTLVWEGPLPTSPTSLSTVKYDPVSGRASEIDLRWNPISLSRGYRLQLAKDPEFTLVLADIGADWAGPFYTPSNPDKPALVIPAGGGKVIDSHDNTWSLPSLEGGHAYYWRVMVQDVYTGDNIQSPWSWRESFIVKQGLPAESAYLGLQLLQPAPACHWDIAAPVCFIWTPLPDTEQYRLELSRNCDMTSPLVIVEVDTTAYEIHKLAAGTYYWRVRASKPYYSEWSTVNLFYVR